MIGIEALDDKLLGLMFGKCLIEKIEIFLRRGIIRYIEPKISVEEDDKIEGIVFDGTTKQRCSYNYLSLSGLQVCKVFRSFFSL